MKKLFRILLAILAVLLLGFSWVIAHNSAGNDQESNPEITAAASAEPTVEPTPTVTPEPTPFVPEGQPQDCAYSGTWEINADLTDYTSAIETFGPSLRDYGSSLIIDAETGRVQICIGETGFEGTFVMNGEDIRITAASVSDLSDIREFILTPVDSEGVLSLCGNFNGCELFWTLFGTSASV